MAYIEFEDSNAGRAERKEFWLSPDGVGLIAGWRREGMTVEEIALRQVGVSFSTWRRWVKESPELDQALRQSQDAVNAAVEASLLKRALGYEVDEETFELVEGEMRRTKVVRKHVPPDTKACLAWLYSRRSDRWRSQQEPLDGSSRVAEAVDAVTVAIEEAATLPAPEGDQDGD